METFFNLLNAIVTPIRTLFQWLLRCIPGFKAVTQWSMPLRVALMTFLFLLIILGAGIANYFFDDSQRVAARDWTTYLLIAVPFLIVLPIVVYYLTRLLLQRDLSRYPDIDRAWDLGIDALAQQGIFLQSTPLFLILGAHDRRTAACLMQASQLSFSVDAPQGENAPLVWYANEDAIYLFLNDTSCVSKLNGSRGRAAPAAAAAPAGNMQPSPATGTIVAGAGGFTPPPMAAPTSTLTDGAAFAAPAAPAAAPAFPQSAGSTMQLPVGQNLADLLPQLQATPAAAAPGGAAINSQESGMQSDRMVYVCQKLRKARQPICPINGILTLAPFEVVEQSGPQVQVAVQRDMATRDELRVRCTSTLLISEMEKEDGFQELVNRVGEAQARDFRFGKGCEVWGVPQESRLGAIATHATGAFEDWIYMLFQQENALKKRYNSRLFMLLCKTRGQFAKSLENVIAKGFGFDPALQPELARSQFLFGGCYFAATGGTADRQAFVKSVLTKIAQQDGELEWTPRARREDQQLQLMANLFALAGAAALGAIAFMALRDKF